MTKRHDDYLWDPTAPPDDEIAKFEQLLRPLSAGSLHLANRDLHLPKIARAPLRRKLWIPLAAAAMCAGMYFLHLYRLDWVDGKPWPVTTALEDGTTQAAVLRVGERISTTSDQTATLSAARIGTVVIGSNSVAHLIRSRKGLHRVELEYGRLHAKIWAPPNYFGVAHGETRFVDLGCEFDLDIETAGNGTLTVASGWVVYRHGDDELLVPEAYSLSFTADTANTPIRVDAADAFRQLVISLDSQMLSNPADQGRVTDLATKIAGAARHSDYYTLVGLLYRHRQLAQSPLYPRLATMLGAPNDDSHRRRWSQGDNEAINQWDRFMPKHPENWWVNWRDAF